LSLYFFIVQWHDMQIDDEDGALLPHDAAAVAYAEEIIRELKEEQGFAEPSMALIVKRQAYGTVLTIPFFPGCA
jgi:hypothetical protein